LDNQTAVGIFAAGMITLWLNWDADHQRQTVRATQGKCKVWGKAPKIIHAQYTTAGIDTSISYFFAFLFCFFVVLLLSSV
jgi:7-dehydrocholesterol reductase